MNSKMRLSLAIRMTLQKRGVQSKGQFIYESAVPVKLSSSWCPTVKRLQVVVLRLWNIFLLEVPKYLLEAIQDPFHLDKNDQ